MEEYGRPEERKLIAHLNRVTESIIVPFFFFAVNEAFVFIAIDPRMVSFIFLLKFCLLTTRLYLTRKDVMWGKL